MTQQDDRGIFEAIVGDGRPLLLFTGLALVLSGSVAFFQAGTGHFLPHDVAYLGMDAQALCQFYECRIVKFMIHDRIAFGGAVVAAGVLYLWLAEFPLRQRQAWAWWAYFLSCTAGFLSFFTYLGYNYLDTWHGVATLLLLPCYLVGLVQAYRIIRPAPIGSLFKQQRRPMLLTGRTRAAIGYVGLLLTGIGMLAAGAVITIGGTTRVFVPQDLSFMALQVAQLEAISPKLVPLIAHDRANFGGALFATGVALCFCVWFARPSRSLWQILLISGSVGFGCALGVHFVVGYLNLVHLLPAYLGASVFYLSILLTFRSMVVHRSVATANDASLTTSKSN